MMLWKRFFLLLEVWAFAALLAYFCLGRPPLGIDDAQIFFVYGRNVAHGQGIVYNVGGERVEGYSSPLWLLIVTAGYVITASPEWLLLGFLVAALSLALAAVWQVVDGAKFLSWRGGCLLLWVLGSPSFVVWNTVTLMDVGLWTAIFAVGVALLVARVRASYFAWFILALVLVRPEGMLWGLVFIFCAWLLRLEQENAWAAFKFVRLPLMVYLVGLSGLFIFRLAYFGYPLPNTFYAKVSPDLAYNLAQGWKYLQTFFAEFPASWFALFFLLAGCVAHGDTWLPRKLPKQNLIYAVLAILIFTGLTAPMLSGGDHFAQARFYQPIWVWLILPLVLWSRPITLNLKQTYLTLGRGVLIVGFAFLSFASPQTTWKDVLFYVRAPDNFRLGVEFFFAQDGQTKAMMLNEMFASDLPSVGVVGAGGFGLRYQGKIVDLVGLNNLEMAHAPGLRYGIKNHAAFNPEVFFRQYPDLVLITYATARQNIQPRIVWDNWYFEAFGKVFATPRYWELYTPAIISNGKYWVVGHLSRPLLQKIQQRPDLTLEILTPDLTGIRVPADLLTK